MSRWCVICTRMVALPSFFKINFFKKFLQDLVLFIIWVSNMLDPDQARHYVGPDLGPICLQRLWADDIRRQRVKQVCLPGVSWWLSGSSSRCHGVVCGLWLWYFLIILTSYFCYFSNISLAGIFKGKSLHSWSHSYPLKCLMFGRSIFQLKIDWSPFNES